MCFCVVMFFFVVVIVDPAVYYCSSKWIFRKFGFKSINEFLCPRKSNDRVWEKKKRQIGEHPSKFIGIQQKKEQQKMRKTNLYTLIVWLHSIKKNDCFFWFLFICRLFFWNSKRQTIKKVIIISLWFCFASLNQERERDKKICCAKWKKQTHTHTLFLLTKKYIYTNTAKIR